MRLGLKYRRYMVADRETRLLVVLALALASPFPLASQQAISLEAGVISGVGFEDLRTTMQFGMRASAKEVGMEIALATFPTSLISGRFLLTGDIGLSVSVPMGWNSDSWLVPHLGVTGIAIHEDGRASGLLPGFGVGIGYLRATSATRGIRFDLTYRRYYQYYWGNASNVLVFTTGLAWL
jgi:hypothetical protein